MFRVIPTMLLSKGRLVKGKAFANHEDAGNPATTSRIYNDQLADEIFIADIDARRESRAPDFNVLSMVAKNCFIPVSFGGGIRSVDDASEALRRGADKVVVNTQAFLDTNLIGGLTHRFGSQAIVASVDYRCAQGKTQVFIENGKRPLMIDVAAAVGKLVDNGVGEIVLTNIDREGMRAGPDTDTIRSISEWCPVPVIAHGGMGTLDDFARIALETDASAVGAGRVFQFSDFNLIKVRRFLMQKGIEMRAG